eukprot:2170144-Amphidinium_carterae.2
MEVFGVADMPTRLTKVRGLMLIVLLPEAQGFRPISALPVLYRAWSSWMFEVTASWQRALTHSSLYGALGVASLLDLAWKTQLEL